jgi:hypothetical protein
MLMDAHNAKSRGANMAAGYQRWHFSVFNIVVRLFGLAATFASLVFLGWGLYFTARPEAAEGYGTTLVSPAGDSFGVAILIGAIGVACLLSRPYRPDLGDAAWSTGRGSSERTRRHWWTGGVKT